METIESAFKNYCKKENPPHLSTSTSSDSWIDSILKGRPEDAKKQFKNALPLVLSKLSQQSSIEDCISICEEVFLPIKGIGEVTALRCAMGIASQLDIDPEANCVCFLIKPAKKTLDKIGWINGKTIKISQSTQELIADYSPLVFVDFINRHYRSLL